MSRLSYIIETNGDNGVVPDYRIVVEEPEGVSWVDGANSFPSVQDLPDPSLYDSPEYVRVGTDIPYSYFARKIVMPAKAASFMVSVISDGYESGAYQMQSHPSFVEVKEQGDMINCSSQTNKSMSAHEGNLVIVSNMYNESLTIRIVQEYTPLTLTLVSYTSEGVGGHSEGAIGSISYTHTFHWLTSISSIGEESVSVEVLATGPRNGFIVRDVSEYDYVGQLDDTFVYLASVSAYVETVQVCVDGGLETVQRPVLVDEDTGSVYRKAKYAGDLKVTKNGNTVTVKSYGRCFLEDDAYYVITLSNVDDLHDECKINLRYESE